MVPLPNCTLSVALERELLKWKVAATIFVVFAVYLPVGEENFGIIDLFTKRKKRLNIIFCTIEIIKTCPTRGVSYDKHYNIVVM